MVHRQPTGGANTPAPQALNGYGGGGDFFVPQNSLQIEAPGSAEADGTWAIFPLLLREALKHLIHAGILQSLRGSRGGYRLPRKLRDISLLEVIEAVDGPVRGEGLPWMGQIDNLDRRLHEICERCAADGRQVLRRVRLADLVPGAIGEISEIGK